MNTSSMTRRVRRNGSRLAAMLMALLVVASATTQPQLANAGDEDSLEVQSPYAVGVVGGFVHDRSRSFDRWGEKYGSADYQALVNKINDSGTPATIPIQIFYPTKASEKKAPVRAASSIPAPLPAAAQGELATVTDLYFGNKQLAEVGFMGPLMDKTVEAYKDAPIADGSFPLLIGVHGGGGGISSLAGAAQRMASQGYVVVIFAVVADGISAPVFEDPQSPFAKDLSAEERAAAYTLRFHNGMGAAFRHWFKNLYQYEKPFDFAALFSDPTALPDVSELKATKAGARKNAILMQEMFTQRLADIAAIIQEMKQLNKSSDEAAVALNDTSFRQPLAGKFTGHIDTTKIGVFGHSLGGMTAQVASAFLEDVDTSVSLANGMQRNWEPNGGFPDGSGVSKPSLTITGSQDFAVHILLRILHGTLFEAAGGDKADNFLLESERGWPTEDNPLPESMAAYERATGPKMYVVTRNQDHFQVTDDFPTPYSPGQQQTTFKIPNSSDKAPGEKVQILGWTKDGAKDVYMPHAMRNWFMTNWFNWSLKGDSEARDRLTEHPFKRGVVSMRQSGVSKTEGAK